MYVLTGFISVWCRSVPGRVLFFGASGEHHEIKAASRLYPRPISSIPSNMPSRPEKYFVTFVPWYERYIFTASADCPEAYGYEDLAIGWYAKDMILEEDCRHVPVNLWPERTGGESERRWQYFWDAGLIDQSAANRWALSAWGPVVNQGGTLGYR